MPTRPRGFYRHLWQAMDAAHRLRVYPATWLQCAGRIARRDYWDPYEFALAMGYLDGDNWANSHGIIQATAGLPWHLAAVQMVVGSGCVTNDQWYWALGLDHTSPQPIICVLGNYGPPFTLYDSRDLTRHWVYTAAPPIDDVCVSHTQYACGPFPHGAAPWLNAI